MNLLITPPCDMMGGVTCARYALRKRTTSLGESDSLSEVNPRMSVNKTVASISSPARFTLPLLMIFSAIFTET